MPSILFKESLFISARAIIKDPVYGKYAFKRNLNMLFSNSDKMWMNNQPNFSSQNSFNQRKHTLHRSGSKLGIKGRNSEEAGSTNVSDSVDSGNQRRPPAGLLPQQMPWSYYCMPNSSCGYNANIDHESWLRNLEAE
jgi:hypothetical protein